VADPDLQTALLTRCTFPTIEEEVTCAVSGGADSLALLALARAAGLTVTAVHVDHGLRVGSTVEGDVVARAAERLGASFRQEKVDIEAGPNLEARARAARYAVLPPDAMLGHTADDQAETMLLNLLRGAALDGLAGMRPGPRRPLLAIRRSETQALCAQLELEVVHDPSNDELTFRRNRVRHELVPLLDEIAERDIVPVLVRQSAIFRDIGDELDRQAAMLDVTDARALAAAPVALARQAVRRWLRDCSVHHHPPSAAAVDRVLGVARGERVATDIGDGWRVQRHAQRLQLVPPAAAPPRTHG
jgi:tRNA(Ile)-lysidine synthase